MKLAVNTETMKVVLASHAFEGEFICPQCGRFLSRKYRERNSNWFFTHSRGFATGCRHKDKDLFSALVKGNDPSVVALLPGVVRYLDRKRQELERIENHLRHLEECFSIGEA